MNELWALLGRDLFQIGTAPVSLGQLLMVPLVVGLGLLLGRWVRLRVVRGMEKKQRDANLVQLVNRALHITVWVVLFMATLSMLKVPISSLAFLSGAVAIGVGFGAQNIINNFISGWILMGEQPIRIGDLLEINQTLGTVVAINNRSTLIKRIDGVHIVIPNSQILEQQVVNWTLVDREVRTQVRVGVAYGSPVREVEQLIHQAVREQEDVMEFPKPVVIFEDFGDNALVFDAYFWTLLRPGGDLRLLRSEVRFRIDELFNEHGIVIAFPQRDVHVDGQLELVDSS